MMVMIMIVMMVMIKWNTASCLNWNALDLTYFLISFNWGLNWVTCSVGRAEEMAWWQHGKRWHDGSMASDDMMAAWQVVTWWQHGKWWHDGSMASDDMMTMTWSQHGKWCLQGGGPEFLIWFDASRWRWSHCVCCGWGWRWDWSYSYAVYTWPAGHWSDAARGSCIAAPPNLWWRSRSEKEAMRRMRRRRWCLPEGWSPSSVHPLE